MDCWSSINSLQVQWCQSKFLWDRCIGLQIKNWSYSWNSTTIFVELLWMLIVDYANRWIVNYSADPVFTVEVRWTSDSIVGFCRFSILVSTVAIRRAERSAVTGLRNEIKTDSEGGGVGAKTHWLDTIQPHCLVNSVEMNWSCASIKPWYQTQKVHR